MQVHAHMHEYVYIIIYNYTQNMYNVMCIYIYMNRYLYDVFTFV
jgi:hypothetical protein